MRGGEVTMVCTNFCEEFCYTVEQRNEWMPGVGHVGKGMFILDGRSYGIFLS